MKLWHCVGARSLRALWALEELGLDYELEVMPFPPRMFQRDFLEVNSLGTIPYLQDGDLSMTESCAILAMNTWPCPWIIPSMARCSTGATTRMPR